MLIIEPRGQLVSRMVSFASYDEHSSPIFRNLNLLKLQNLIHVTILLFMFDYHCNTLPDVFHNFFTQVKSKHNYNTRLATRDTYYISKIRTNYGKFSLRFQGPKLWNELNDNMKILSRGAFKQKLFSNFISEY